MELENQTVSKTVSVAIADDHLLVRETVMEYLQNLGGITFTHQASNGQELLKLLEQSDSLPDVCMVDIMMHPMNGLEVVSRIRSRWSSIKILVLSAFLSEELMVNMIMAGANGYLTKDNHPKEIRKAIFEIHSCGIYNTELFSPRLIAAVRSNNLVLPQLTEKEIQLMKLSISDLPYHAIAEIMHATPKSIEGYRYKLFQKLGVNSRVGLALAAIRFGLISLDSGVNPR
jgi:two-component system invasion response regulator UvrY